MQEDIGQKQLEVDRLTAENKLLALRINEKNELLKSWNEIADIWVIKELNIFYLRVVVECYYRNFPAKFPH